MADATAMMGAARAGSSFDWLRRLVRMLSPWLVVLALLVAWEWASTVGLSDPRKVSHPTAIAALIWDWVSSGRITPHITVTLYEVAVGYVLGTALGMGIAFLFFFKTDLAALLEPLITVLSAAPRSVLAPFFVLVFGMGVLSKIMLVILAVFIITLINLYAGLRDVDRTVVDNARVMGAQRWDLIKHVYVPAALVWIVGAMRISIGQAFTAAIICELLGATRGLGWIVAAGQASVKPDWIMGGLFFASVIVVVIDLLILAPLERRGSHWRMF
jgi:NitT/TauT family transport system permease protein